MKQANFITFSHISALVFSFLFCEQILNAQQDISVNSPCNPVTNLSVTYTSDCEAILAWNDVILWDNRFISFEDPIISSYWTVSDKWVFTADDFIADGQWIIKKIYTQGLSVAPSELPIKFTIVIYLDDAGKPGTEIYRNTEIFVTDGANPEICLPVPFELPDAGKYWLVIAGAYDTEVNNINDITNYRWSIMTSWQSIGTHIYLQDKTGFLHNTDDWFYYIYPEFPSSMYFMIEGEGNAGNITYNVYRDGMLLTTIEETSYTDTDFDPFTDHTWEVTVVCTDSESEPMSETLKACELTITTTTLSDGFVGEPYEQKLTADGYAPVIWTLESGNLPAGLTLKAAGTISGTPTTEEVANFMIKAQNNTSSDTKDFSITIKTLGITEISTIAVYPNPTTGELTIDNGQLTINNVEVFDIYGRKMPQVSNLTSHISNQINIAHLPAGIYFIKRTTDVGTQTQKVIKL